MSLRKRTKFASAGVMMLTVASLMGWAYAQRGADSVAPEKLLPERSIIYIKANGSLLTDKAFKKTASYKALYDSGLMQAIEDGFASLPNDNPYAGQLEEVFNHLSENGLSVAITDGGMMQPWGVVVVHDAVGGAELLNGMLELLPRGGPEFQEVNQQGRAITMTMIPGSPVELGWWEEQGHLVIAVGMDAIRSALAVADGERPNLTTNALYKEYSSEEPDFTVASIGWFDFAPLVKSYGAMPLPLPSPEQITINKLLEAVGLDSLDHVVAHNGYKGEAIWAEQIVKTNGETTGLLELAMQKNITFADLPPIPVGQTSIAAASFDWSKAYETVWGTLENLSMYAPPRAIDEIHDGLAEFQRELGFSPEEFLNTLGHVHCGYMDKNQGMFGIGGAILISVKDADHLRDLLGLVFEKVEEESRGDVVFRDVEKHGRTMSMLQIVEAPVVTPTICVDDDWLIVSIVPQAVESVLMRMDGKLPKWEPSAAHKAALKDLPKEFTSITIIDPKDTYRFLLGFAPMAVGAVEMGLRESRMVPRDFQLGISAADFPPNEVVMAPLFPNVMMSTVDGNGIHSYSRQSMPGIPLLGGSSGGTTIATTAVLVALLLTAVQQAREAARRTQSKNNIKQLLLAMHNYHDTFRHFPQGTVPNEDLEIEERLSWLISILPFADQAPLYNLVDMEAGWKEGDNRGLFETLIPTYLHPSDPQHQVEGYGGTHYIGMAGLGPKGPTLPANDPKAGVFAYDRATRMRDITDGTSNTIAIGETADPGPYAAGGRATIRPLNKQRYINGGNGFGSRSPGGANFGLADGSVRFISENIDPEVMEALSTISGGEVIGQF